MAKRKSITLIDGDTARIDLGPNVKLELDGERVHRIGGSRWILTGHPSGAALDYLFDTLSDEIARPRPRKRPLRRALAGARLAGWSR